MVGVRPCCIGPHERLQHSSSQCQKGAASRRVMYAQVPGPVRRDGGGPAAAAVLRLQHRALLLRGVPEGGLARGPQGRVPAPASARLTGAAAWQVPCRRRHQCLCTQVHACDARLSRARSSTPDTGCQRARAQQAASHVQHGPAWCASAAACCRCGGPHMSWRKRAPHVLTHVCMGVFAADLRRKSAGAG